MPKSDTAYDSIDSPILLVGPPRSGTTWLSHAFEQTDELAFFREPRQIWEWWHWFRPHEHLTAEDATPRVKKHIRRRFELLTRKTGRSRFCDKTPSNCLRLRFIHEVYPKGKIVFIVRDGRAVIRSTAELQVKNMTWRNYLRRIRLRLSQSSLTDLIGVLSRYHFATDKIMGRPIRNWGTHPPGWQTWSQSEDPEIIRARQWAATVNIALDDLEHLPRDAWHFVRYEDMVVNPREEMEKILCFVNIGNRDAVVDYMLKTADPSRQTKWHKELSDDLIERVRPEMHDMMGRLVRMVDKRFVNSCSFLVATTPAFVEVYYRQWLKASMPAMIIENKLESDFVDETIANGIPNPPEGKPLIDRPMRIGYFGGLRCEWSWRELEAFV